MGESVDMNALFRDATVSSLGQTLASESTPLGQRFRALFSLKHLASQAPENHQTLEAIQAIAATFTSPSALVKHELAYCLGQTKNTHAAIYLRQVLEDRTQDEMCRHEAAEALAALGDASSLDLMRQIKDDAQEPEVVRETCDIAVDKLVWAGSEEASQESIKQRFAGLAMPRQILTFLVISPRLIQLLHSRVKAKR